MANFLKISPKEVEGVKNSSYFYYRQQLLLKVYSIFKFTGVPDHWDINYFKEVLFNRGYIAVVKFNDQAWRLEAGVTGYNAFNNPTGVIVANPVLGNFEREIGTDAELVYFNRIFGRYYPVNDLITRYAVLLRQCDASLNATLMNSRVRHVFTGTTDAEVQSYKKMYDEVSSGKPAVFLKKGRSELNEGNFNFLNVRNTYIGNDILLTKRSIMNEFLTEIGIANANTDKRERLTTDEVNVNNAETEAAVVLWYNTISECLKRVNKMFGLNIGVEFRQHLTEADDSGEAERGDVSELG